MELQNQVESFIAMYGEFSGHRPLPPLAASTSLADALAGKRQSIPDAAYRLLSNGSTMTTHEILAELDEMGVTVGGDDPSKRIINLSSSLSRDKRFENVRGKGWIIKPRPQVESPSSVGADDGLEDL